jgi:hypothetical protein
VLEDNCRIGHEWPEVVWLEARVSLKTFEKGRLISVVVRNCRESCQLVFPMHHRPSGCRQWSGLHDCFTHISFFHARLRRRLLLRSPSILSTEPSAAPYSLRGGDVNASSGDKWERPKALKVEERSSRGKDVSSSVGEGMSGAWARVGQTARRHGAKFRGYERPRGRAERLGRGILELAVPQHLPSIQERSTREALTRSNCITLSRDREAS